MKLNLKIVAIMIIGLMLASGAYACDGIGDCDGDGDQDGTPDRDQIHEDWIDTDGDGIGDTPPRDGTCND